MIGFIGCRKENILARKYNKFKRWCRKQYIIYKYKHNFKSGKVIYLRADDRQFGLSTLLINDAIRYDIPILVPNLYSKKRMAHEIYMMGQLSMVSSVTEDYAMKNLVVTPIESNLRGLYKLDWILVDNQCNESDVKKMLDISPKTIIANGFVTSWLMA